MANIEETESNDTVWVSIGITKNLGNYESLRIDAGARVVVHDGENKEEVWGALWDEVDSQVDAKVREVAAPEK